MAAGGLAYDTLGEGPTVLLLHPIGLDSTFWRSAACILAARFRVVSPDLPGHGKTSLGVPAPVTTADYAAIVASFISDNGDGPAHAVIGLSFGGMIAQELALARPDLVGRLGLCGCTATFPDAIRPSIRERAALAEREGMAAVADSTLARWFTEEFLARDSGNGVRARLLSDDVAGWATAWRAIAMHDAQARLESLSVPTLCLAGEKDVAAPPAAMHAMAKAIPQAGFAVLPAAPHMMHIETPAAFAAALSEFLA